MNDGATITSAGVDTVFAALGDRLRLRIACCLLAAPSPGGLCVCELVDAVGETQPNVSRHLKLLQAAGLVRERRQGRWIYHELTDSNHPLLQNIRTCLDTVCCCGDVQDDLTRLRARLALREGGKCVVGTTPKAQEGGGEGNERARLPVVQ
ncbi:MAG TPA: metalloregulator ArsR/SmtB family transcription factor [Gemmatimonadales bacterium]|jgi:ArsR family transcriptional regulator|nr:metalloregulator ArsR/SmtB family transcription factor [Gemmatimonadales bacterium]